MRVTPSDVALHGRHLDEMSASTVDEFTAAIADRSGRALSHEQISYVPLIATTAACSGACTFEYDISDEGLHCCDSVWTFYQRTSMNCASLSSRLGWDCSGCNCPGDPSPPLSPPRPPPSPPTLP
eukprot:scaffold10442_cov44-Phaeocystis_antarctica.AAC.1